MESIFSRYNSMTLYNSLELKKLIVIMIKILFVFISCDWYHHRKITLRFILSLSLISPSTVNHTTLVGIFFKVL